MMKPSVEQIATSPTPPTSWLQRNGQKVLIAIFWVGVIAAYQWYAWSNNLSSLQVLQQLVAFMQTSPFGPLIYIGIYALRPLFLFSAVLLTVAGGFVFGPFLGVLWTIIGSNASASVAYVIGRFLGQGLLPENGSDSWVQRYADRMRHNSFETILIMRFIYLPYDLVNYLAGFLRIRYVSFILATVFGSIPGTLAFVLFGASIERFDGTLPAINPWVLGASVVIFVASLVLSRLFKRRESVR
jgi:uncharacterized membrane protein YdjX (TVP38/TMEM64 family)